MKFLKVKQVTLLSILSLARAQTLSRQLAEESSSSVSLIILVIFLFALVAFIYYDRRQNYIYLLFARDYIQQRWAILKDKIGRWRNQNKQQKERAQALDGQQSSKSTFTALEHEKTFVDTDRKSMQQTISSPSMPEDLGNLSLEDDTPQVNIKDVFGPDKKHKGKDKKSKSKLRGRVQIKKSELEAEAQEEVSNDFSQSIEQDNRQQLTEGKQE